MSLFFYAILTLIFFECFKSSQIPGTPMFKRLENYLMTSENSFSSILTDPSQCPALLENDGHLLSLLLGKIKPDHNSYEHLLMIVCKYNIDVLKMAMKVAARNTNDTAILSNIFAYLNLYSGSKSRPLSKIMFEECACRKNYGCVDFFGESLCRITDHEGRNVLHIAAQENDEKLFDSALFCKFLIDEKDFEGKLPMEHVTSVDLARKFNDKWLKVAKEEFLSLESSAKRLMLCANFQLESDGSPSNEEPEKYNRIHFDEALKTGIESVEDVYSPYLKMRVNLLEGKGRDGSGMVLEWLTYLLNDIFRHIDKETTDTEMAAETADMKSLPDLFTKLEATNEYIPTGEYSNKVYEFVGKVLAIARYFGLGHAINLSNDPAFDEIHESIRLGAEKMKFMRLETHRSDDSDILILKGRKVLVQIFISDDFNQFLRSNRDAKNINLFKAAFENLSDAKKLKFLSLVLDEKGLKNGEIEIVLCGEERGGDYSVRENQKKVHVKKFGNYEEYSEALQRITDSIINRN